MPRDNLTLKIVIYNNRDHCTVVMTGMAYYTVQIRVRHIIPW